MKINYLALVLLVISILNFSCRKNKEVENGVSKSLAAERKALIENPEYDLFFEIPESRATPVKGKETIKFELNKKASRLVLDFKESSENILKIRSGSHEIEYEFENEHIIIPGKYLSRGINEIEIEFIAGDLSLNRQEDFMYTLFVPDRARTAFPCFDQPDIKAVFRLKLEIPAEWLAVANGRLETTILKGYKKSLSFSKTKKLPTYLFAFTAGRFFQNDRTKGKFTVNLFHRETDSLVLNNNIDEIFHQVFSSLEWMEEYTGIPYPFAKYDLVAIPSFQYGGMEHTGATLYRSDRIFLPEEPTREQLLGRANLIAHETAHMWFGDLVAMKWFSEVWLKEVFANFIADKITYPWFPETNHELKFLLAHYPPAYSIDRTDGANPVQQNLNNLEDAGTIYGSIIYHKAPLVMKKLEQITGETKMQRGLREYLKNYAYDNAEWEDLIGILDPLTQVDLRAWSRIWLYESGMPLYDIAKSDSNITITQLDESGHSRIWPDNLLILDNFSPENIRFNDSIQSIQMKVGEPWFVNTSGMTYGYFKLENTDEYLNVFIRNYQKLNELERASQWLLLYENLLNGEIDPSDFLKSLNNVLNLEKNPELIQSMLGMQNTVFWRFLKPSRQKTAEDILVNNLWSILETTATVNKKAIFNQIVRLSLSGENLLRIKAIWEDPKSGPVNLSESELMRIGYELMLKIPSEYSDNKALQSSRINNSDRLNEFHFISRALHPDKLKRQEFFLSLSNPENRERESWVVKALSYLNHPLRQSDEVMNIYHYLELLPEIKETGDIFFPKRWLDAVLGGHNSKEARMIVETFLASEDNLSFSLRQKILQSADMLIRAESIVNSKN